MLPPDLARRERRALAARLLDHLDGRCAHAEVTERTAQAIAAVVAVVAACVEVQTALARDLAHAVLRDDT